MIVFLTGFMGSGKTTVGKKLAEITGFRFFDLDEKIVRDSGMEITGIFRIAGESGFRKIETESLKKSVSGRNNIIALGGGGLIKEENLKIVKDSGTLVYLKAPLEELLERIISNSERPLINRIKEREDKIKELTGLFRQREKSYLEAGITIDTEQKSITEIAEEIKKTLNIEKSHEKN